MTRVPHITLKSIANNAEIDVIWDRWQQTLEPLRADLNAALGHTSSSPSGWAEAGQGSAGEAGGKPAGGEDRAAAAEPSSSSPLMGEVASEAKRVGVTEAAHPTPALRADPPHQGEGKPWQEWQIPREADPAWPEAAKRAHAQWWDARIARQKEIDASIAAKAEFEYLYDKPYTDSGRIRVAGPFTVESLSPHRVLAVDAEDELIDLIEAGEGRRAAPETPREEADFAQMILDNLRTAGVQQAHKADRIAFTSLTGWPGKFICAEGRYVEGGPQEFLPADQTLPARSREGGNPEKALDPRLHGDERRAATAAVSANDSPAKAASATARRPVRPPPRRRRRSRPP